MKILNLAFALTSLIAWVSATPAAAAIIPLDFSASIDSGTLAGTKFQGSVAYDNFGSTGVGVEYFSLTSINFILDGVQFSRGDVTQGGQMLTLNGAVDYFTASFFPAPPGSPVSDITFGFGGPGVIGIFNIPDNSFGTGSYTLSPASIPEPLTILLLGTGLMGAIVMSHRKKMLD